MTGISGLNQVYYGGQTSASIGTLMGSLGTPSGVNAMTSVLSDYKTIQTGTYGKLLKAYYAQDESQADQATSAARNKAKAASTATNSKIKDSLSDTRSKMEKLNTSASKLADTGKDSIFNKKETLLEDGTKKEEYDVDAIYKGVSDFAKDYNNALSAASSSSYKTVSNGSSSMTSTTEAFSKTLQRFGISTDTEGKLSIDEKEFKKSDMDKVKSFFSGSTGYASSIASTASRVAGTSNNKLSMLSSPTYAYGKTGNYQTVDTSALFNSYF